MAPLLLLPAAAHADSQATVTSPDGVNLRAGPGTSFPILVAIPGGTTVTVTGTAVEGNWLPVTYDGRSGYVLGEYLAPVTSATAAATPAPGLSTGTAASPPSPSAAPTPTPIPVQASQLATVNSPDGLNLRTGPGTNYPVLVVAPAGARVQVMGRSMADGWYSVVYNDKLGWATGQYLTFATAAAAAVAAPAPAPGGTATTPVAASRFAWPVESRRISTPFSAAHPGIDIDEFPNGGNPVSATAAGTVTFTGGDACCSYGLYVIVKHSDGYTSLYAHLSSISVSAGQEVKQGALLGKSGNTGFSTGAHLHFEVRKDGVAIDPLTLLPGSFAME